MATSCTQGTLIRYSLRDLWLGLARLFSVERFVAADTHSCLVYGSTLMILWQASSRDRRHTDPIDGQTQAYANVIGAAAKHSRMQQQVVDRVLTGWLDSPPWFPLIKAPRTQVVNDVASDAVAVIHSGPPLSGPLVSINP